MYPVLRTIVVVLIVVVVVWLAANDKHRSNTCVHSQQRAGRGRGRGEGASIAVTARHINSNGLSASPTLGVAYKLANL